MSGNDEAHALQLWICDEAMDVLAYFCGPEGDIWFEPTPPLLAALWINRWSNAPFAPDLHVIERATLHPLMVILDAGPLEQLAKYARSMRTTVPTVASAVVSRRGEPLGWLLRNRRRQGFPQSPPAYRGP